jgi:hypothetical protein
MESTLCFNCNEPNTSICRTITSGYKYLCSHCNNDIQQYLEEDQNIWGCGACILCDSSPHINNIWRITNTGWRAVCPECLPFLKSSKESHCVICNSQLVKYITKNDLIYCNECFKVPEYIHQPQNSLRPQDHSCYICKSDPSIYNIWKKRKGIWRVHCIDCYKLK